MNRYTVLLLDPAKQETEKLARWVMWSRAVDAVHELFSKESVTRAQTEETLLGLFAQDHDLATVRMPDGTILVIVRGP